MTSEHLCRFNRKRSDRRNFLPYSLLAEHRVKIQIISKSLVDLIILSIGFYLFICVNSKILNQSLSSKIIPLSPCKAQLNDGRLIDLTSLDDPTNPRVAEKAGFKYKFNPCSPIPCEGGV
ncbi:hypothetical protein BpHYR1_035714 [Brachionus plicatilis]|uniref:Uncharacterized protein n=1 Tax=Brachionus plicatilis TaxID=10195 RepID=A0A3M7Q0G4_BRAPC|nr:hypothetical protein BpHYR1_035714 [Brachionus plicatilis]